MKMPVLRNENGCTLVDVVVNLDYGFGTLRGNRDLVMDCRHYERQVWLKKEGNDTPLDCKSILSSIYASTIKGGKLQIIVEGEDDKAKAQALRLYSALSSEETYNMQFDGFSVPQ